MANFMSSGVSWFIIILTLTSFKSFKSDGTVVADSGGTVFPYFLNSLFLLVRIASESECIHLMSYCHVVFRWGRIESCKGERGWNSRHD